MILDELEVRKAIRQTLEEASALAALGEQDGDEITGGFTPTAQADEPDPQWQQWGAQATEAIQNKLKDLFHLKLAITIGIPSYKQKIRGKKAAVDKKILGNRQGKADGKWGRRSQGLLNNVLPPNSMSATAATVVSAIDAEYQRVVAAYKADKQAQDLKDPKMATENELVKLRAALYAKLVKNNPNMNTQSISFHPRMLNARGAPADIIWTVEEYMSGGGEPEKHVGISLDEFKSLFGSAVSFHSAGFHTQNKPAGAVKWSAQSGDISVIYDAANQIMYLYAGHLSDPAGNSPLRLKFEKMKQKSWGQDTALNAGPGMSPDTFETKKSRTEDKKKSREDEQKAAQEFSQRLVSWWENDSKSTTSSGPFQAGKYTYRIGGDKESVIQDIWRDEIWPEVFANDLEENVGPDNKYHKTLKGLEKKFYDDIGKTDAEGVGWRVGPSFYFVSDDYTDV